MAQYTNTSNKLIIRETPRINGLHVQSNHIKKFAELQPEMFEGLVEQFQSKQMYVDPIKELLGGNSTTRILEDGTSDTWTWKQRIRARPAYVTENLESTNTTPGIRKTRFKLKLNEDWFSPGEIITPDKKNFVRICQEDGSKYTESGGTVYVCEYLDGNDVNAFLPTRFLAEGIQWITSYNLYGEEASQASGVHEDGSITLQDTLGDMMRFTASSSGYVNDLGVINFINYSVDPQTGETIEPVSMTWANKVEAKIWRALDKQKWNYLFYGVGDNNLSGEKGRKVRSNFGFKYMLENWSNTESYNTLSSTLIREMVYDLFIGKMDMSQVNIEFVGGLQAEFFLDEALKRDTNNFTITEDTVLRGNNPMDLEYGYQIKRWVMPGGARISFRRINFPDTDIVNGMRDVTTGRPIESGHMYVFNLSGDLKNNLQIVKRKNSLRYGYTAGTGSNFANGGLLSYPDDRMEIWVRDRVSPWIQDISNCAMLKYKPL